MKKSKEKNTHFRLKYGKYSKITNTFPHLFPSKMLIIRAGIHKLLIRIANSEDLDQNASSEAILSGSTICLCHFGRLVFEI